MNHFLKRFLQLVILVIASYLIGSLILNFATFSHETETNIISWMGALPLVIFISIIIVDRMRVRKK